MYKFFGRIVALITLLWLMSCSSTPTEESPLSGRLLLWHSWSGDEAEVLNELLGKFTELNPEVTIIPTFYPREQLPEKFRRRAASGLGPDVVIAPFSWARSFANAGLIQNLSERDDLDTSAYFSAALKQLAYKNGLYGLPFSLHTHALYYNKEMVTTPPKTLSALLDEANQGKKVALNTNFKDAFWGVQAFGGQLVNQEGRLRLDQGGFANWLDWLKNAQKVPNIILSNEDERITALFEQGQVAYYVSSSLRLPRLRRALGKDVVGVAALPAGPYNSSGPFLQNDAFMFSRASPESETLLALRLSQFLTSVEQQTALAIAETGHLPVNSGVRIDPQVSPAMIEFMKQSRTALPIRLGHIPQVRYTEKHGDQIYAQVLEGVVRVNEAVREFTEQVNSKYGFEPLEITCPTDLEGTVQVLHDYWFLEEEIAVYQEVANRFMRLCPKIVVELMPLPEEEDLQSLEYDLLIKSTEFFDEVLASGKLRDITHEVEPEFLQRYIPTAVEGMSHGPEGSPKLYGLPSSVQSMALYYNRDLVSEPATTLEDLLNQVNPAKPALLQLGFDNGYWGVPAFGGRLFDEKKRVILNQGGLAEWLSWLQRARNQPGMLFAYNNEIENLIDLFGQGSAAYLTAEKAWLSSLQSDLGEERLGVVPLPIGPRGTSGPFITVKGLMFNSGSSQKQAALALELAKYLTSVESQRLLLEQAALVPANVNADTADYPAIQGFVEQAKTAIVQPSAEEINQVLTWGDTVYEDVLQGGLNPPEAVNSFTNLVNELNDFVVEEPALSCEGEGEVLLWHSWSENQVKALSQIIADFADFCPKIKVNQLFVPADTLADELSAAVQNDTAPDFFLAPHDLIVSLSDEGLIKKITTTVDQALLAQHSSNSISAFRYKGNLYGWPQAFDVMALYVNTELAGDSELTTVDDLLAAHTPESPLALDSSFIGAFWGVSAFGATLPVESIFDENGNRAFDKDAFVEWLRWLQAAQDQPGIIFSADQEELMQLFADGKAAYLVSWSDALPRLQAALGVEKVELLNLPEKSEEESAPSFMRVEGFLFSEGVSKEQTKLALTFAHFATSKASQTLLRKEANLVPTHKLLVARNKNQAIDTFLVEVDEGLLLPHHPDLSTILSEGDALYEQVLQNRSDPTEAVQNFMNGK